MPIATSLRRRRGSEASHGRGPTVAPWNTPNSSDMGEASCTSWPEESSSRVSPAQGPRPACPGLRTAAPRVALVHDRVGLVGRLDLAAGSQARRSRSRDNVTMRSSRHILTFAEYAAIRHPTPYLVEV